MLAAIAASVIALGVGATDANKIIVRIDGKETPIVLAGVSGGSERGAAFTRCLVAGRVVRVSGPHGAAKVTMLDDSSVANHVAEFLQSSTTADPCTIGKAAYQAPAPAAKGKKAPREVHVSFGSSKPANKGTNPVLPSTDPRATEWGSTYRPPAPPPPPPDPARVAPLAPPRPYPPPRAGAPAPPPGG